MTGRLAGQVAIITGGSRGLGQYCALGFAKEGARCQREDFTVSTFVNVIVNDDVAGVQQMMKPTLARQLGGMGSKGKNFYAEFAKRMGYEDEVEQIQTFYLAGEKEKAANALAVALNAIFTF